MKATKQELFRRIEAAQLLGVHPRTIDRWMKTGQLHPIYHGRIPFFTKDELYGREN